MTPSGDGKADSVIGPSGMLDRLRVATRGDTYARIGRATGCNSETVRRYLNGGTPSVQFISAVAEHYGVSADWLLLGRGPRAVPVGEGGRAGDAERGGTHAQTGPPRVEVRQSGDGAFKAG